MYLIPLVRVNRAIASTIILPEEPIKAIAISEIISAIEPILNFKEFIVYTMAIMYRPEYSSGILEIYKKHKLVYKEAEICCLLLFLSYFIIQNI
tara:strand:+ start:104 stop:385 length:282 start_codon:yes stop_codon:yes gene_type:complete